MINSAYLSFAILGLMLLLFVWGRWRYDIVALFCLLLGVIVGIVPYENAFLGFANPAVITVASVMIMTHAVSQSGILDYFVKRVASLSHTYYSQLAVLCVLTAFLSAFMNNVGALALMMPVAIQLAIKSKYSPSLILMPLSFSSVLGGLLTAIGTPPNLLISSYREQITNQAFAMFDFTPVGIIAATVGVFFVVIIGWRLLPARKSAKQVGDFFEIHDYTTEIKIPETSPAVGKTMRDLENAVEGDFVVVGMIRKKKKRLSVPLREVLQAHDILIIQASHGDLDKLIQKGKLELVTGEKVSSEILRSEDVGLIEAVVPQGSRVEGRSAQSMRLRSRFNLNMIAIARQGKPFKKRLNHVSLQAGDVVMLQGKADILHEKVASLGMLPLLERGVQVGLNRRAFVPIIIFLIAIVCAATQILPVQISFAVAVVVIAILNIIPPRRIYDSIDWPVIILLGAVIPLGQALQSTGGTGLIAGLLTQHALGAPPYLILGLLFIVTMTLSDIMNNAATAVVMAPIAATLAESIHANVDPFLMTVAIAASCSFLTPISHQNNTIVMGPGGYKFFDYFRMGLPLEIIILFVAIPAILWVWPL